MFTNIAIVKLEVYYHIVLSLRIYKTPLTELAIQKPSQYDRPEKGL